MAKKKNILLTHGSLHVSPEQMMTIDIEGAPASVKQVSIYDFNHELLYNKTAPAGKELAQWEITKIQRILNRARVLVGHSLDSDLMALRRRGVYLYNDTRCLDTYFTMMEMKEEGLLDSRYNGATLKETALYFHIRANDYHTSHTDALATTVVMQEMLKLGDGMVVEITPSIIQIPRPPFGMEPNWEKEERGDMQQNKPVGPKADSRIYRIGDFYECVIAGSQGPSFLRMTQEEYDLFLRIRELRPDYTVRLYSETILTPSIVARLAALEEAETAKDAAPVAQEIEALPEEETVSKEIEETPAPEAEEIAEEVSPVVEEEDETMGEAVEDSVSEEIVEASPVVEEVQAAEECEVSEVAEAISAEIKEAIATEAEEILEVVSSSAEETAEEASLDVDAEEAPAADSSEEVPEEIVAPSLLEIPAEEVEVSGAEIEESEPVAVEEALEESAVEAEEAPVEEISTGVEPVAGPFDDSEIPVDVDHVYNPIIGTYESVYKKAPKKEADDPISCVTEEVETLPSEEIAEVREGASEPLFGEGIWDLPEDFPVVKETELPAEDHERQPKPALIEEDEYSMNLFFDAEEK